MRGVSAIEAYRAEHGVMDRRSVLGPEPADRELWRDWRRTTDLILDVVDVISPPARTVEVPARRIEARSMEIEF